MKTKYNRKKLNMFNVEELKELIMNNALLNEIPETKEDYILTKKALVEIELIMINTIDKIREIERNKKDKIEIRKIEASSRDDLYNQLLDIVPAKIAREIIEKL